ncbi:hypothetical protein IPH19_04720 [Candidatus Uhrbacteria bacterium]|nr:MAG: hypothetical protein IPH19_04720 [Candidatus Uhrbacteria bacterium]
MKEQTLVASSALILIFSVVVFAGIQHVNAVTETRTSRAVEMKRIRMNAADLSGASNVSDPDGSCSGFAKRVVLDTIPAAGQVTSIVTKVRNVFSGAGISQIGVVAVRAEQGGVQLSSGNIAVPHTDLKDTSYVENRMPTVGEYAFYDEDASWQVVAYICGRDVLADPMNISTVTTGTADFYIMETRN